MNAATPLSCRLAVLIVAAVFLTHAAQAAESAPASAASTNPSSPPALVVHFDTGSAEVRADELHLLDQASRLYRDGHPIVMVLTGSTDTVGSADLNLRIAEERANAVLRALVARGIPAERFQVLAKGESELPVPTGPNVAEAENRQVRITWR